MAVFIREWIINIIALVLFIVLVEIIIPSGKIRKYVNLLTGFILIIVIVNPLIGQIKRGISFEDLHLANSAEAQRLEIINGASIYKDEQIKQIIEVYRQKVIAQLERSAAKVEGVAAADADVIINEDHNSDNFGEIKRAYVYIRQEKDGAGARPVGSIKSIKKVQVEIGGSSDAEQSKKEDSVNREPDSMQIDDKIRNSIEKKVGDLFGLEADDIVIGLIE